MTTKKRKPKAVVVDCDDILYDFVPYLCFLYNKINATHLSASDVKEWEFENIKIKSADGSVATGEGLRAVMNRFEDHGLYTLAPLVKDAKIALEIIKSFGYKIIILTARPERFGEQTYHYFLAKDISYDELIFSWDKVAVINKLSAKYDIELFIDDKYKTVEAVNKYCKVKHTCIATMAHNEDIEEDEGITRVNNLFECVRYLRNLND